MKNNLVLSFKKLTQAEKAAFTSDVILKMTNDPQFKNLKAQVDALKVCYDAYMVAASNANYGGKLATLEKDIKLTEMTNQLTLVAFNVEVLFQGNEATILAAGFEVRKKGTPITELSTPVNVKGTNLERSGSVKLQWDAVPGAAMYAIEKRKKGETSWANGDYCASRSKQVEGLEANVLIEFQLRAISDTGIKSNWCQPVEVLVS